MALSQGWVRVLVVLLVSGFVRCWGDANQGPLFIQEPPNRVDFSNTTGINVVCSAYGNPPPVIHWVYTDGSTVADVPGLRKILSNGTLVLVPFPAEDYRPDVHSAVYRCVATNIVGTIISKRVYVRAVVKQFYEVQVYDEFVIQGNTAVLRCQIPSFVRDYVIVISWIRGIDETIITNVERGGRFSVFPSGELHIRNVTEKDGVDGYRCETRHILTGEQRIGAIAGRVIVTTPQSSVPPRVTDSRSVVQGRQKEALELPCAAQGFPLPFYSWFITRDGQNIDIDLGGRIRLVVGSLYIDHALVEDSGRYTCVVNNTVGAERSSTTLIVTAPLSAYISPHVQPVDVGKSTYLNCTTEGHPQLSVTWLKDGKLLENSSNVHILKGQVLRVDSMDRKDRGMYQCIVSNNEEMAQGTAQLKLGDAGPVFEGKFPSQTLDVGRPYSARCEASGSPPPAITWQLDGQTLSSNQRVAISNRVDTESVVSYVNISSLHLEDGGVYECVATNSVSRTRYSATLRIRGDPYIKPMPDKSVVAGKTSQFQCRVSGHPIREVHWEKDGKVLPENHRQIVFPNGTLIVREFQKAADAGGYVCVASNPSGETARRKLNIQVLEAPEIDPIHVKPNLQRGMRMHLTCVVSKGDFPISIRWLKDGESIPYGLGVSERTIDEYSSTLAFSSLTVSHTGNYTCQAANSAATTIRTTSVTVKVPPSWLMEPQDTKVIVGGDVLLPCAAEGLPQPKISWRKEKQSMLSHYEDLRMTTISYRIVANGSLWLQNVKPEARGNFLCQASNDVGADLSKVVHLTVHVPARFASPVVNLTVARGSIATVECMAVGDQPISVTWYREGLIYEPKKHQRAAIKEEFTEIGLLSRLVIRHSHREDSATFACVASNHFGNDRKLTHLMVLEPPEAPLSFRVTSFSSRAANLSWDSPYDGNSDISSYTVQYRNATSSSQWKGTAYINVDGDQLGTRIDDLQPAHHYQIRVVAENSVGTSNSSEVLILNTSEEIPGGPPNNFRVSVKNSESLLITWTAPDKHLHHGEIMGYYIGYRVTNSTDTFHYKTLEVVPGMELQYTLTNLRKFTEYTVLVQAYNRAGAGPRTHELTATTDEDVPSAPPIDVQCTALSSKNLLLFWSPPIASELNGVLLGYKVIYRAMVEWDDISPPVEQTIRGLKLELFDLEKYRNYSIEVKAYTRKGDGVPSRTVFCRTQEDVPGEPGEIKALVMDSEAILLSWRPPSHPNGRIRKYKVFMKSLEGLPLAKDEFDLPPEQTYYIIKHLKAQHRYEFWVTAFTVVGQGKSSRHVVQSPAFNVPARIASFSDKVISAWKEELRLPCQMAGTGERVWKLNGKPIREDGRVQVFPEGSLVIISIQNLDGGNYSCHVENRYGKDEITYAVTVHASRNKGIPLPPADFHVGAATVSTITLDWKQGSAIGNIVQGYYLHYKREFGEWDKVKLPVEVSSYTIENLQCGTKYQFFLRAYNQLGLGNPTPTLTSRTLGHAPVAPKDSELIRVNSTSISLNLGAWKDGDCPITSLVVEYKQKLGSDWTLVSNNIKFDAVEFLVLDLSPETWYTLRMTAHNSAGSTVVTYKFVTLTNSGGTIAPDFVVPSGYEHRPFYNDLVIMIPIGASLVVIIVVGVGIYVYWKRRKEMFAADRYGEKNSTRRRRQNASSETALMAEIERKTYISAPGPSNQPPGIGMGMGMSMGMGMGMGMGMEGMEGAERMEGPDPNHREDPDYLATPMRVSLGRREDISPYATFRLPGNAGEGPSVVHHLPHTRHHRHEQHCAKLRMPTSVRHSSRFYERAGRTRFPSETRKEYGSCANSIYTKIRTKPRYRNENLDWIPLHSLYQAHRY